MNINKMLAKARKETKQQRKESIRQIFQRMTTDQLEEIVYGDPTETRLREILVSADGLHLLESG